ncbi:hypothetical protein [Nocardioides ochotonae]|uniref:hypothetical protein n=1 Tax=Nocardioides ochotonae TaxID=2685869 RepID=UPI001407C7EA|nr:hypothetical protein [Nocardioides ochotonae]
MSESSPSRPRQVTFAAWLIMGGSLFVLVSAFEQMAGVQSLDTRRAVQDFLAEPPADGLGVGVQDVLNTLRVMVLITGACATATLILGFQVLQRSRSARLALSVLAVPLFVCGLVVGGIMSSFVAAAVVMLWVQPARDWFNGKEASAGTRDTRFDRLPPSSQAPTGPVQPGQPGQPNQQGYPPAAQVPPVVSAPVGEQSPGQTGHEPAGSGDPRPWSGFGTAGTGSAGAPATYPAETRPEPASYSPSASGARRRPAPQPVVWACVITWVMSGLVGLAMGLTALALAAAPGPLFEEMDRRDPELLSSTGMTEDDLRVVVLMVAAGIVVWCVLAALVAVFAFRRVPVGRVLLMISASCAALLCLAGTVLGSPLLVVPLVACGATMALLMRPEVTEWYAGR